MDAIKFIKSEHDHIRKTFAEIADDKHREETKKKLFDELSAFLIRHETMEQNLWYPNFKDDDKVSDTVKHLMTEEKKAESVIKEMKTIEDQSEWEEKFNSLKKDVEHHANEEEQKLFPKVEALLSIDELDKIGKELREFKIKADK